MCKSTKLWNKQETIFSIKNKIQISAAIRKIFSITKNTVPIKINFLFQLTNLKVILIAYVTK